MPETQAKSGAAGASATPDEAAKDAAAVGRDGAARAATPADAPSQPKFTRAPGMAPPPGEPPADGDRPSDPKRQGPPAVAKGSATVPIVTKGKAGAAPGRTGGAPQKPGPTTGGQRAGAGP